MMAAMKSLHKKIALVFTFVFLFTIVALSQNQKIDSLKSLLEEKQDCEYIDLLFELTRAYGDIDHKMCFEYANDAYNLALNAGDTVRIVRGGRLKAQALRRLGNVDSALVLFGKVLVVADRHKYMDEHKTILNAMGTAYQQTAQYDKALKCFFEGLTLSERNNKDVFHASVILNNIGLVYFNLGDYKNALTYYKRSVYLREGINNKYELEISLTNIALCLALQHNFIEAENYINKAFALCDKDCSPYMKIFGHSTLGIIYYEKNDYERAENEFAKSNMLNGALKNSKTELVNLSYLLSISIKKSQSINVEKYLKSLEDVIASSTPFHVEVLEAYPRLLTYYINTNNYEKAAFYQNRYITLKDSLLNNGVLISNLMKIEAEHLEKENLTKIESQNKILALNNEVILIHKFLNVFVGVVALLLIALIFVLIKSNQLKQKHNILLDKKVQERTHQLQLNHDSLQRASQERDILLQKISSDINNALVTLKGLCSLGMKDIQDPHALEYISKMNTTSESFSNILKKLHFIRSGAGTLK
jgi:tetratricopeptide (TPR) repeat protein